MTTETEANLRKATTKKPSVDDFVYNARRDGAVLRAVRHWWAIEQYNNCSPAGRPLRAKRLEELRKACAKHWPEGALQPSD